MNIGSKILLIFSILALIAMFVLGSCTISRNQAERKVGRLLEMYPDIIKTEVVTDTVYKVDTLKIYIPAKVNLDSIMGLMDEYCQALRDSATSVDTVLFPVADTVIINLPAKIRKKLTDKCTPAGVIGVGERMLISGKDTIIVGFKGRSDGWDLMIINHKREINRTETKALPVVYPTKWELLWEYWPLLLIVYLCGAFTVLLFLLLKKFIL